MNPVQVFRESAKLSQRALADRCGCSQPTIAAIEAGGKTNVHLAQRIAAALDQPVSALFPLDDAGQPGLPEAAAACRAIEQAVTGTEPRPDVFGEPEPSHPAPSTEARQGVA